MRAGGENRREISVCSSLSLSNGLLSEISDPQPLSFDLSYGLMAVARLGLVKRNICLTLQTTPLKKQLGSVGGIHDAFKVFVGL
ncbi:hypothetical protein HS088_TW16G00216 [Tripterygium wilfordii]|uniref:Uncharacterized protein n=1 Tax=Tripterygium wilfordii TaxID=458696 RepID=A0A7J7CID8_TRIWF|nr:hypothetical protein HS088_TW16G00216 [Tripterygium wilfordii]